MPDVDLAVILADGEYLKREGDELVGVAPPSYSVARLTYYGSVGTDAWGQFAIGTGFMPTAALCVGTQSDYPFSFTTSLMDASQVIFRARNLTDAGPAASTVVGVCYVIFGPPIA